MKLEPDAGQDVDIDDDEPFTEEEKENWYKLAWKFPKRTHTNNNKLQYSARSLELIYRRTDWPPGTTEFSQSLFESGKSRADLWAFAGQVGLEKAMKVTNENCRLENPVRNLEYQLTALEGEENCQFKLRNERILPFRFGRSDCIPDQDLKMSPYPFEATRTEKHANAYGTAHAVVEALEVIFVLF